VRSTVAAVLSGPPPAVSGDGEPEYQSGDHDNRTHAQEDTTARAGTDNFPAVLAY
jgi:hypothetical protein